MARPLTQRNKEGEAIPARRMSRRTLTVPSTHRWTFFGDGFS